MRDAEAEFADDAVNAGTGRCDELLSLDDRLDRRKFAITVERQCDGAAAKEFLLTLID